MFRVTDVIRIIRKMFLKILEHFRELSHVTIARSFLFLLKKRSVHGSRINWRIVLIITLTTVRSISVKAFTRPSLTFQSTNLSRVSFFFLF